MRTAEMYYKKNKFENAVLFHNNTVVEQIESAETEIVSVNSRKPVNCPHPEGITLTIEDAQLGIPESSEPLRYDIVERMMTSLKKSPFGSGYLIARFLERKFSDDQLLGMAVGHYRYYGERDPNSNGIFESTERMSYECTAPRIRWDLYVHYPYWIGENVIKFRLGGGVHSAIYQFNRFTGELVDIIPDNIPSDVFYTDGKTVDISRRRQWLLSCSQ